MFCHFCPTFFLSDKVYHINYLDNIVNMGIFDIKYHPHYIKKKRERERVCVFKNLFLPKSIKRDLKKFDPHQVAGMFELVNKVFEF